MAIRIYPRRKFTSRGWVGRFATASSWLWRKLGEEDVAGPPPDPFSQTDWPNPVLRPKALRPDWIAGREPTLPLPPPPFSQTDWPNPVLRPKALRPDWIVGPLPTLPLPQAPFRQSEWPLPVRVRRENVGAVYSTDLPLLAPPARPFFVTDWPNPIRRPPSPVPRDWPLYFAAFIPPPVGAAAVIWKPVWVPRRRD